METETSRLLGRLRALYGATWQLWVIYPSAGGTIWCARRHDDHQHTVNEDTAEALELRLKSEG
jgi:hypothetical protein